MAADGTKSLMLGVPIAVVLSALEFGLVWLPSTPVAAVPVFFSQQIAWSKIILWFALMTAGFAYVAIGPNCKRTHPFASRRGSNEFGKLLFGSFVIFVSGPIRTIAAVGDQNENNVLTPSWPSSPFHVFLYNTCLYIIPFLIGCNFFFLDRVPQLNRMFYKLTWPPYVSQYRGSDWVVLFVIVLVVVGLVGFHVWALLVEGYLLYYGTALIALVILFILSAICIAPQLDRHVHLHHYIIFGLFVALIPLQNPISAVTQAACAGIFVEGIATWGMDSLFPRNIHDAQTYSVVHNQET